MIYKYINPRILSLFLLCEMLKICISLQKLLNSIEKPYSFFFFFLIFFQVPKIRGGLFFLMLLNVLLSFTKLA